jgi:hypothetical protein
MHVELVVRRDSGRELLPDVAVAENANIPIRPFRVVAVIEAMAVRTADGYDNFQPVSLNVPTGMISATKHQKRDADAWIGELRERGLLS